MGSLPRGLEAWSEPLGLLREELAVSLGAWLLRLAALIGPLREREQSGGTVVAGVSGLTRRGAYERLLISEWALAQAMPLEFLRRAADREHLFTDLERHEPAGSRRCVLLLDAGPEQLGAPRLAHIAALIVLARRAEQAKATLAWGILQREPHAPHTRADAPSLERLIKQRAGRLVEAADLTAWLASLAAPGDGDEVWVVGSARTVGLATRTARTLEVEDAARTDGALVVRLRQPGGMPRTLELPLPDAGAQRLLLTQPLRPPPTPAVTPRSLPTPHIGPLVADLRFTVSGQRILARSPEGAPVVLHVPKQSGQTIYRSRLQVPQVGELVGQGWYQQEACLLYWQREPNRLMAHGSVPHAQISGCPEAYFDLDPADPIDIHCFRRGRAPLAMRFIDRRGVLFSVNFGTRETEVLRESALGLWSRDGRCVMLSREGTRVILRMENANGTSPTVTLPEGGGSYQAVYSVHGQHPLGLLAFEHEPGLWRTLEDDVYEVLPGATVHGVVWRPALSPRPALLIRSATRRTLALVSVNNLLAIPTEEATLAAVAMSPDGSLIAWLTEGGELVIWNTLQKTVRGRLQLTAEEEVAP